MKIYLCGPINGCTDDDAASWREWFKRNDDLQCVDPMRRDYRGGELENYREIVELDKIDIQNSDAIVVMYKHQSVGTSMEILFAWSIGKPVILIDECSGTISPWLRYHATSIVRSKEKALEKIKEWFYDCNAGK